MPSKVRTRLGEPVHQRWPATAARVWTAQATGSLASPVKTCVTAALAVAGATSAAAATTVAAALMVLTVIASSPGVAFDR